MEHSFKISKQSSKNRARLGILTTPHGQIETPNFIPVGTQATVKALTPRDLKEIGAQIVFANTYHLWLRPGEETIKNLGGLHKFMGWDKPIVTDSGGFQVFSLGFGIEQGVGKIASIFPEEDQRSKIKDQKHKLKIKNKENLVKIDDDGVTFRSHLDGTTLRLTPEKSIKIQEDLGADIILAFDECTSPLNDYEYTKKAMERTHAWAKICLETKTNRDQALWGIVQGGAFEDLRKESSRFISSLPFDGFAIGGSLGRSKEEMHQVLDWSIPLLPEDKPRHLLGIGGLDDIVEGVKRGIDLFDCVIPTRLARNQTALSSRGELHLINSEFKNSPSPIQADCQCYTCQNFSLAYLNHLFHANEILGIELTTIHNVHFVINYLKTIREKINRDNL